MAESTLASTLILLEVASITPPFAEEALVHSLILGSFYLFAVGKYCIQTLHT